MSVDFTKKTAGQNAETLETDKSVHETVRKAIRCADSEDSIVLSMESAMALITEWDALRAKSD